MSRGNEYPLLGPAARARVDALLAHQAAGSAPDARSAVLAPVPAPDGASEGRGRRRAPSAAPPAPFALPSEADDARPLARPSYRAGTPDALAMRRPVARGAVRIASIDPGLDRLSVAFFDARLGPGQHRYRAEPAVRAAAFTHIIYATTRPEDPMPDRLAGIGRALAGELAAMGPAVVYVERPATAGAYYRRDRPDLASNTAAVARALALSYQALGVVLAVCGEYARAASGGRAVVDVVPPATAFGKSKDERLAYAALLLRTAPRPAELPNADDRDAFAVGVAQGWAL